jgi:hypothetical protein
MRAGLFIAGYRVLDMILFLFMAQLYLSLWNKIKANLTAFPLTIL